MMMEVDIISREIIKPSSPAIHHLKPFKLSLLDQITPTTYAPLILFYPKNHIIHSKNPQAHLKNSLSETLNSFYPFSGRMKDNLFIDYYDEGIPYNEARVHCCLSDFLQHPKTEFLNHFLPCCPFRKEPKPMEVAPLAVQVNIFDCGGIAIGFAVSHKFIDGTTMSAFLNNWAATAGGPSNKLVNPNFTEASSLSHFPPQNILPHIAKPLVERLWFCEGKYKTRRFVFDAKAIATLRAKARSERVENPTRIESLSSFICKHASAASRLASGSPRPSILAQAISIRGKAKPRLADYSMGNIFWWALAAYDYNSAESTETEMRGLVATLKEAVSKIDSDVRILQGHEGFIGMIEYAIQKAATVVFSRENPEIFAFTSWLTFGFNKVDFGWGKPIWVGLMGEVGSGRKLTILQNAIYGKGIEAWVTLDENVMAILEDDAEFLALATLNPSVISP
ncbi:vinorine synthase [Quercus suber]|uniref:Vinorine synthase n=1 Tax=Quercus suber TaxID=58331 RepID=A0AAW0IM05_QUESU|nr:vinorine synthase-like [Quercus suber]